MKDQVAWAADLARTLLERPLPRRWAHTQGVAEQARNLAPMLGDDAGLVEAAAWLHDIGYSPDLVDTGFHPLDGARYLSDSEHADDVMCRLVAHHTNALGEAAERGLADHLVREFPPARPDLLDALTYCDMTTSPNGNRVHVRERIAEILTRYDPDHVVSRTIRRSVPDHLATAARVECRRLVLAATG
jgi:hypothetical protein